MFADQDLIVIDDDDDDNVEIIDADAGGESSQVESSGHCGNKDTDQKTSKKQVWPKQICGYSKPSLSYPIMIAHALASSPLHQATAIDICNIIAENHPYFKVCPFKWRQSVFSALTRRKKCFVTVNTNPEGEYIWSYNPLFAKYMLENWVPKYKQVAISGGQSSDPEVYKRQISVVEDQVQINLEEPSFVSVSEPTSTESRCLIPENNPWEVETHILDSSNNVNEGLPSDFLPGNACYSQTSLSNDEALYRLKFQGEHPKVEKFRLHCTVCDTHLGTAGHTAEHNVRFHSRLGVLTCAPCYTQTVVPSRTQPVCQWCNTSDKRVGYVSCFECTAKFCLVCVKRNFGEIWLSRILGKADWKCFLCDMKQIWPHRAIAYSLYTHYTSLRKMKNRLYVVSKGKSEQAFYLKDKSTCCKIDLGAILKSSPALTTDKQIQPTKSSFLPKVSLSSAHVSTNNFVSTNGPSQNPTLVIQERSPNHFVVQSSEGGPYVTVNTGTQYIHNIYPESNFTIVQPPTMEGSSPRISTAQTNKQVSHPLPIFVDTLDQQNTNPHNQPPSQQISFHTECSRDITTALIVDNSLDSFPADDCLQDPLGPSTDSTFQSKNSLLLSNKSKGNSIISLNNRQLQNLSSAKNTFIKMEHEKIKNRPMPKSKKNFLLRSILERQQLESMTENVGKNPVASSDPIPDRLDQNHLIDINNRSVFSESKYMKISNQEISWVGIKSDHSTTQLPTSNVSPGLQINSQDMGVETKETNEYISNNMIQNANLENSFRTNHTPKIKVKTLEELQNHQDLNRPLAHDNSLAVEAETEQNHGKVNSEVKEVDVTFLKQGIIEGSRTLVTTQKKFKELARTISSQVLYETKTAKKMVKKFQEILKLCRKQIEDVNDNISQQYKHLFPNVDIGSLLKSIQQENEDNTKKEAKCTKSSSHSRKINKVSNDDTSELTEEDAVYTEAIKEARSKPKKSLKRKRESVDINPLGKKIILGSPIVTQEDVDELNNPNPTVMSYPCETFLRELKSKQLQLRKKREIWSYKKRTKWSNKKKYKYNYKNKKSGRKKRKYDDYDCSDEETLSPCYYKAPGSHIVRCSTRVKPPSKPLRVSQRNHPSTACLGLLPSSTYTTIKIKPCSVMLHRLDPRIVQLLEMRF